MPPYDIKSEGALPESLDDAQYKPIIEPKSITADANSKDTKIIASAPTTATVDIEYPSGMRLGLIITSAFISMFLVSLVRISTSEVSSLQSQRITTVQDRMIITTAIPQITDDFNSVTDIGWYGSAYLLTTSAFQLLYGKIYSFYSIKATYLIAISLFEIGSAVSGAAPNSVSFIIGRALAGVGGAGITGGMVS